MKKAQEYVIFLKKNLHTFEYIDVPLSSLK